MGNNKPKATNADAAEAFNKLATKQDTPLTYEEAFEMMENANESDLQSLSSEYFQFQEKGKPYSFLVMGFDTATLKGKQVEIVKLQDKEGNGFINGDKVFMSCCKRLDILPAYVRATWTGDKEGKDGTYKEIQVKTFPIPVGKQ